LRISSQSRHSVGTVLTKRSAIAFAFGARTGLQDPDLLAAEDLVERAAVLAVAVADQEADPLLSEGEAEVARLLSNPARVGVRGAPASHTRRLACSMKNKT
jgi:hypothetical protein